MTKLEFVEAVTDEQLHRLADLANEIWHEFFPGIITEEQIDYMLEKFQSFDAMKRQIAEEGYHYKMTAYRSAISVFAKSSMARFFSRSFISKAVRAARVLLPSCGKR